MRLILFLVLLSSHAMAQSDWKVVEMDDNLSFSFPADYTESDTAGQHNFLAQGHVGSLQGVKVPQGQAQIRDEKELIRYYREFERVVSGQSNGVAVTGNLVEINELLAWQYKFETTWSDTVRIQENFIIMIDGSMYMFAYAYPKEQRARALMERHRFFSGITIRNTDFEDQLTIATGYVRAGEYVGYAFRYIFLAAFLLAIVFWFTKKYRYLRIFKDIFSWVFLSWAGVSLFLYFGNIFFGERNDLHIPGLICLVVGSVLRIIRIPAQSV